MFWETMPGEITAWAAAVAGLAAAVKAVEFLGRRSRRWTRFWARVARGASRLVQLADETEWPNGADSLPHAMREIYDRQGQTHELIKTHIKESKQQYVHHLEEWHDGYEEEG